jgi:hypothetical protein
MRDVNLNWRHKAGLFLALAATGLSLLLEFSSKQTVGIFLLGAAFAWIFGSLSLRMLGLTASILLSILGLCIAVIPVWQERQSNVVQVQEYDAAITEIRSAVAKTPPRVPPLDSVPEHASGEILSLKDIQDLRGVRSRLPAGDGRIAKIDALIASAARVVRNSRSRTEIGTS